VSGGKAPARPRGRAGLDTQAGLPLVATGRVGGPAALPGRHQAWAIRARQVNRCSVSAPDRRGWQLVALWAASRSEVYPAGAGAAGSSCQRPNSFPCGSRHDHSGRACDLGTCEVTCKKPSTLLGSWS